MSRPRLVRAIVVNHDAGPLLARAVQSLLDLDWPDTGLQVVVVDNASTDDSLALLPRDPRIDVVVNQHNIGFGAAVNQAVHHRGPRPDAVLLLNPDAWIEREALAILAESLVETHVGAACPRIVFDQPMAAVSVDSDPEMQARVVAARVDGRDVFASVHAVTGAERRPLRDGTAPWFLTHESRFHVPHGDRLELDVLARRRGHVALATGSDMTEARIHSQSRTLGIDIDRPAITVVQNDGSSVTTDGTGHNRHFHWPLSEVDAHEEDVFAWCGAAALLRTDMLDDIGLLVEDFFLYYEDTDLAWRGRAAGWRHRLVPTAVVHHRHSANTGQGQAITEVHQHRNRVLMVARNGSLSMIGRVLLGLTLTVVAAGTRATRDRIRGGPGDLTRFRWRARSLITALVALPRTMTERGQVSRPARRLRHDVMAELDP